MKFLVTLHGNDYGIGVPYVLNLSTVRQFRHTCVYDEHSDAFAVRVHCIYCVYPLSFIVLVANAPCMERRVP